METTDMTNEVIETGMEEIVESKTNENTAFAVGMITGALLLGVSAYATKHLFIPAAKMIRDRIAEARIKRRQKNDQDVETEYVDISDEN